MDFWSPAVLSVDLRFETPRFSSNPDGKFDHFGMKTERFEVAIVPFQLFFSKNGMDLIVTRPADSHRLLYRRTIELPLVSLVAVTSAGNEMVPSQGLFATADGAIAVHGWKPRFAKPGTTVKNGRNLYLASARPDSGS